MKEKDEQMQSFDKTLNRRSFVTKAAAIGAGATAATFLSGSFRALRAGGPAFIAAGGENTSGDTAQQIFTAALIAEDLATTFYYNGLVGAVIQDPALAGPGGSATDVTSSGDAGNVGYIRAALSEEITHANLLRAAINGSNPSGDPYQTFYFPTGSFDTLAPFLSLLDALENAFIGAYLTAVLEFGEMALDTRSGKLQYDATGKPYTAEELVYSAQVAASIMGIESEHRVLGRDLSESIPANQLNYEQTDGLTSVFNGSKSAVVALTPFLAPGPGLTAYLFATAIQGAPQVTIATTGTVPPQPAHLLGGGWRR
jgi:ferritin-like protein